VLAGALTLLGGACLFLGVALRREIWTDGVEWRLAVDLAVMLALGALAYSAAAAAFAAWFRRPLAWAAFFVVGVQMLTANLPASAGLRHLTIADPLRRILLDRVEPDARLARLLWPAEREFQPELIGRPYLALSILALSALVACVLGYTRSEYDSRTRE
jgi:hypothetical protein